VLDSLASVRSARFGSKREVRTRSAHGRITAYVLAGTPSALGAIMMIVNPEQ
jgi:Flp pilus assembly protein TadB